MSEIEFCKARINLNGDTFECHCPADHITRHRAGVALNSGGVGFVEWDIDDLGRVIFEVPERVALTLFREADNWMDGYTAA
jgi:hypothetical protein